MFQERDDFIKHFCDHCEKCFKSKYSLKTHLQSKHEGDVKYACNQCDYEASTQGNL